MLDGGLTSVWAVQSKVMVASTLKDYDQNGVKHYVFALASIDADGNITDLRPQGSLDDQQASDALKKHEESRNHPDATLKEKGFVQLSSATDSASETTAATPKAVKAVNDNANTRLKVSENLKDLTDINAARKVLSLDQVGNYKAVQASGGLHSSGQHAIYLDWGADGKLHATVDTSDVGELFTTANPPNAAQTGAYPKTGGNLDEEASISLISNSKNPAIGTVIYSPMYRVVIKGRGGDQDFKDGASGFMRIVEEVGTRAYLQLQWDGFGSVREFRFDQQGNSQVYGKAYTGSGASFLAEDGNVYGTAWGGYLSNWVAGQIDARINNNNNWINASFATAVRLGAERVQASTNDSGGLVSLGNGEMLTGAQGVGGSDFNKAYWRARAIQYFINGQWVQGGSV